MHNLFYISCPARDKLLGNVTDAVLLGFHRNWVIVFTVGGKGAKARCVRDGIAVGSRSGDKSDAGRDIGRASGCKNLEKFESYDESFGLQWAAGGALILGGFEARDFFVWGNFKLWKNYFEALWPQQVGVEKIGKIPKSALRYVLRSDPQDVY